MVEESIWVVYTFQLGNFELTMFISTMKTKIYAVVVENCILKCSWISGTKLTALPKLVFFVFCDNFSMFHFPSDANLMKTAEPLVDESWVITQK